MSERCEKCGQVTEYNGWPNYETWVVNLWLENDQGTYNMVRDQARIILRSDSDLSPEFRLAEWLKDLIEQNAPWPEPAGMYSDLLSAALSSVDWRVIAESWLETEREEATP